MKAAQKKENKVKALLKVKIVRIKLLKLRLNQLTTKSSLQIFSISGKSLKIKSSSRAKTFTIYSSAMYHLMMFSNVLLLSKFISRVLSSIRKTIESN